MPSNTQVSPVSQTSQTVPRFHPPLLQVTHSDKLLTNARGNHTEMPTGPFPQVGKSSQPLRVREAGGARAHCTKAHFSHKTQTLREVWKRVQEQAHGQLLHLMKNSFTFPTRDLYENAWLPHRHDQDPLLRASLQGNGNHGTFPRWAAT